MKAIDYEEESAKRGNWLDITGGTAKDSLTVLDYFAGKAMAEVLSKVSVTGMYEEHMLTGVAFTAYQMAKEMLDERNRRFTPQGTVKGVTGKTYG